MQFGRGNSNANYHFGQAFAYVREPHQQLRGGGDLLNDWMHIKSRWSVPILNVTATTEDKRNDSVGSFSEKVEQVSHTKYLVDFN
jgi:hypothetical protein